MSEYVPWFRRTAADRERYTPLTIFPEWQHAQERASHNGATPPEGAIAEVPVRHADVWEKVKRQIAGQEPIESQRGREYCTYIVHAVEANEPFRFNGNVPNTGLITNLPPGCNVEVPIFVDNAGLHPCYVGDLPSALAGINRTNVNVQELTVNGFLNRDREAIHQACLLDPLAAASASVDDIRSMVDELFEANARWLDRFQTRVAAAGAMAGAR